MFTITCATIDGEVAEIQVAPETTFETVKEMVAVEFHLQLEKIKLVYQGDTSIPGSATLEEVGVEPYDMIAVNMEGQENEAPINARRSLSRMTAADIFEQQQIEREIAIKNINENIMQAFDESPEAFATVLMLYIPVEVNRVPVKAFVDSGAQTTVMSRRCAQECGIMRLVDPRFAGVAVGVGQARILGRVHQASIKIGSRTLNCSFTVLDGETNMDLLLGLDMLKKHGMMIDLRNDCLHLGDQDELIPFLSERDVPPHARLH
mmetsp:Transcript_17705/g.31240  ORF Transcript_17705/g.31240 Transcript_17705/m.31240 type:complete len:263 (+) Transcript_17705:1797-2585(+)